MRELSPARRSLISPRCTAECTRSSSWLRRVYALRCSDAAAIPSTIHLSKPVTVLGRTGDVDVALDSPQLPSLVSRRHVRFVDNNGEVIVEDLGAKNGVLVNGRRVASAPLRHGDIITLGGAGKAPVGALVAGQTSDLNYEFFASTGRVKRLRVGDADASVRTKRQKKISERKVDDEREGQREEKPSLSGPTAAVSPKRRGRPPKASSKSSSAAITPIRGRGPPKAKNFPLVDSQSIAHLRASERQRNVKKEQGSSKAAFVRDTHVHTGAESDDESEASISDIDSSGDGGEESLYSDELDGLLDDAHTETAEPNTLSPRNLRSRTKAGSKKEEVKDNRYESAEAEGATRDVLEGVRVRPYVCGPRVPGTLAVSATHLSFVNSVGKLDLKYSAIEHIVFQPPRGGTRALIQLFLRKPRRLQKDRKKVQHVLFWGEAEGRKADRPGMHRAFVEFMRSLKERSTQEGFTIDLDPPARWQFEGRPNTATQVLQATRHCIVSAKMSDPFFLVMLGPHIKAMFFERVKVATSFDMVLILQVASDVDVQIIQQIPAGYLETLHSWATGLNYPVYQGPTSLNWGEIIDRVEEDPRTFENEGGWDFLKWVGKDDAYDYESNQSEEDSGAEHVGSGDGDHAGGPASASSLANLLGENIEDDDEIFVPEGGDACDDFSDEDDKLGWSASEEWD